MSHNIKSKTANEYSEKCEREDIQKPKSSTFFRPWVVQKNEATSTESLVDQQKDHTEYKARKGENKIDQPTNSKNMTSIPSTSTIPPSSMAAIQQSMAKAVLPTSVSPYSDRMAMNMMSFYTQPYFMGARRNIVPYPTHYNPVYPYMYNMPYQLHQHGAQLIPELPGYARNVVPSLPYALLPRNPVADHYYDTNVATHWSDVPYSNSMVAQYLQKPASTDVYPTAVQQNMYKRIQQRPSSAPLPTTPQYIAAKPTSTAVESSTNVDRNDSTSQNTQSAQENMVNTTPCPEKQTSSTTAQVANEPKATNTQKEAIKSIDPPEVPTVLPTSAKTNVNSIIPEYLEKLLQVEESTSAGTTKRKSVDDAHEDVTAKKLKMLYSAWKLDNILKYRPNMARNRPKKDESEAKRLAREQNTIACRKYRRMRLIAKIMEQQLLKVKPYSQFEDIL